MKHDGYTAVKLADPWNLGKTLHTYLLVAKGEELPAEARRQAQGAVSVVRVPLERTVVATSVHCGLMQSMNCQQAIAGVCDVQYINLPFVQQGVKGGKIADCGSGLQPTLESIIDLQPDAIFLSPFQNSGGYGRIEELNVPIIETADYMETSALGRAEWIRFFGLLYGRQKECDSIFREVSNHYNSLKELAARAKRHPSVITDLKYGSTWYVPGGKSTTGMLLADAAADYIYKDNEDNGSLALAPEVVFERAINAEIWMIRYTQATSKTYDDIAKEYTNYTRMKAFENRNIYSCNTELVPFYSEVPFHPDRLLEDYIKILHPELLPDYNLKYYERIEK